MWRNTPASPCWQKPVPGGGSLFPPLGWVLAAEGQGEAGLGWGQAEGAAPSGTASQAHPWKGTVLLHGAFRTVLPDSLA